MSIYASIGGIGGDEPCGAPWTYQGSHILPDEEDPRDGGIALALIPSHISRDGRDEKPDDGRPWPWLRLTLDDRSGPADAVINPAQARRLAGQLTAWADSTDPKET